MPTTTQITVPDTAFTHTSNIPAELVVYETNQSRVVNGVTKQYNRTLEFGLDSRISMTTGSSTGLYGGALQWDLEPLFGTIILIEFTGSTYTWVKNGNTTTRTGFKFYDSQLTNSNWPSYAEIANTPWSIGMNGSGNPSPTTVNSTLLNTHIWDNYSRTGNHYLTTVARCSGSWSTTYYYLYKFRIYGTAPNSPPNPPIIVWPASVTSGTPTTYNHKPWLKAQAGHDDDSDAQTIQYKIDSGSYADMNTSGILENATTEKQHTASNLTDGSHTIYMKSYDGTAYSTEVSRVFNVATAAHTPSTLTVGNKIELQNLTALETQIQTQRKYYGYTTNIMTAKSVGDKILSAPTSGSSTGYSLKELHTALSECKGCTVNTMAAMPTTNSTATKSSSIDVLLTGLSNA